jgi:1,4-alpha-glucan branching enzyme
VLVGAQPESGTILRSLYHAWRVDGPSHAPVSVFPRDARTGVQVWSGERGYPGDPNYLDFHKKRFPGGHRYWRVTGHAVDASARELYSPEYAAGRVEAHAQHFVGLLREVLASSFTDDPNAPVPVLSAPFDAELFGHWWFEGAAWLEAVCRHLHAQASNSSRIEMVQCSQYLDRWPRAGSLAMNEGSWGAEGSNRVWLNPETSWTWGYIYAAERFVRTLATGTRWQAEELAGRVARQLCRELLLLESSDWQFLITTGAARDYAEMRFHTHNDQFQELKALWEMLETGAVLSTEQIDRLHEIEARDPIFPEIDPAMWAEGARENRTDA